ncbi:MAG TPA: BadF/BadG/BcrA/BcrD ATPase family protein [Acidobacteriota bacterium]|jgi:N-acetylglucosamine kinase-like BadF-type ATPase
MSVQLILGVDGGQSHTEAVLGDASGRILATGHAGPSNHIQEPGGPERFRGAMKVSIYGALEKAGLKAGRASFAAAHFGLSGGPSLREPILNELFDFDSLSITEDTSNALWSVTAGKDGMIVIAGSGSNAFGKKGSRTARVGGWGYVLGDEGSGYDIGLSGLKHVFRAHEKRDRWGWLADQIMKQSKAPNVRALHDFVYEGSFDKVAIGHLSKLVDQGVKKDPQCRKLLADAADDLFEIAERVILNLGIQNTICGYVGKVFQSETVRRRFFRHIKRRFPRMKIRKPATSPGEAAFEIALEISRDPDKHRWLWAESNYGDAKLVRRQ